MSSRESYVKLLSTHGSPFIYRYTHSSCSEFIRHAKQISIITHGKLFDFVASEFPFPRSSPRKQSARKKKTKEEEEKIAEEKSGDILGVSSLRRHCSATVVRAGEQEGERERETEPRENRWTVRGK